MASYEHKMWVNLNNFRKANFMLTIDDNVCDYLTKNIPDWFKEPPVWDNEEQYELAKQVRKSQEKYLRLLWKLEALEGIEVD